MSTRHWWLFPVALIPYIFVAQFRGGIRASSEYKASAGADIENKGSKVISNIGDQYSDLANSHAENVRSR
jgi:hypothetical protein